MLMNPLKKSWIQTAINLIRASLYHFQHFFKNFIKICPYSKFLIYVANKLADSSIDLSGLSLKKIAGVLTIARLNFPRRVMANDRYFEVHMVYFTAQLLLKTF